MKNITLLFCLCAVLASRTARADSGAGSLFFTSDEVQKIAAMESKAPRSAESGDVNLGAVFYYGPGQWTLWLQGRRWTPDSRSDDVRVIEVSADEVRLGVALSPGGQQRDITLKPYQTYRLSTGEVEDGLPASPADLSR